MERSQFDADDLDIDRDPDSAEETLLGDADEVDRSIEEQLDDRLEAESSED